MTPQLPSFLRRRMCLSEARRVLLRGAPEEALDHLADPALEGVAEAERLLETVLGLLCREAVSAHQRGDEREARRVLETVARHDPERAAQWRRRLVEEDQAPESVAPHSSGVLTALEGLLSELRDERVERGAGSQQSSRGSLSSRRSALASALAEAREGRLLPFWISAPGLEEHLVLHGPRVELGEGRGELRSLLSFHRGPGWLYLPAEGVDVALSGDQVEEDGVELVDGDALELSSGETLSFHAPVAGSATALLVSSGRGAPGARERMVLLGAGAEHALRLAAEGGHLAVPGLMHPARLSVSEGEVELACVLAGEPALPRCATPSRTPLPLLVPVELALCSSEDSSDGHVLLRPLRQH